MVGHVFWSTRPGACWFFDRDEVACASAITYVEVLGCVTVVDNTVIESGIPLFLGGNFIKKVT